MPSLIHSSHPRLFLPAFLVFSLLGSSALGQTKPDETREPVATTAVAPVGAVPEAKGYKRVSVVGGLNRPWGIVWLPDASALITEKSGKIRVLRDGKLVSAAVANVPDVYEGGQGGLMDIALSPKFGDNRRIFLTSSIGTRGANATRVTRAKLVPKGDSYELTDIKVIFEVEQKKDGGQHFGSRLQFLPDGTLLVSIGDGGNPPAKLNGENIRNQAQSNQTAFGKTLRMTEDGAAPSDNPFVNDAKALHVVWTMGHRNIQGMTIDPDTGRVFANEHGARGGDEINIIQSGKNYGWPLVTFSREYWGPAISKDSTKPGFVDPVVVYVPSTATSGLAFYSGDKFPKWKGNLLSGGLISQDVRRIAFDSAGRVTAHDAIKIGKRVRDVRQGPDGFIYVLTDESDGELLRIEPRSE